MLEHLTAGSFSAHNYDSPDVVAPRRTPVELVFDATGTARYRVPPRSVSALVFTLD